MPAIGSNMDAKEPQVAPPSYAGGQPQMAAVSPNHVTGTLAYQPAPQQNYGPPQPQQGYSQPGPQTTMEPQAGFPPQPRQMMQPQTGMTGMNGMGPQAGVLLVQTNAGQIGADFQAQLFAQCAQGNHNPETKYGVCGIITAVCCFPIGLIALCVDNEKRCTRCGLRLD